MNHFQEAFPQAKAAQWVRLKPPKYKYDWTWKVVIGPPYAGSTYTEISCPSKTDAERKRDEIRECFAVYYDFVRDNLKYHNG